MTEEKACPQCAESVKAAAKVCKHCGYNFEQEEASDLKAATEKKRAKGCLWVIGIIIGLWLLSLVLGDPPDRAGSDDSEDIAASDGAREDAEERAKGFHCLSGWDGSNRSTVDGVKGTLRNPDSFEHVETEIYGNDDGEHGLWMTYRAENGFGGMNVERIYARVDHDSCDARLLPGGPGSG